MGVVKFYGERLALDGVDLEVARGECVGLLGANGAGKSTLVRAITGTAPIEAGTIRVLGHDVAREARAVKRRTGVVPQDDNLDAELTVRENLLVFARFFDIGGRAARARADHLLETFALDEKADARVEQLSGGMRRRLLVARALVGQPELLVLDEPTVGLDPAVRRDLWAKLRALKETGVTQLLTTHYMDEAERLCDRIVVMDRGRIVKSGTPRDVVAAHGTLEAAYLDLVERMPA
jgi:lipooligosaccharide transport system ATP-binding protein